MPIAEHLLKSRFRVLGFDTDPARLKQAIALGVSAARNSQDLAAKAEVILTVLPSSGALQSVCEELMGLADKRPRILVEISTLEIEEKLKASQSLATSNITLLDCPVLGTSAQAYAGELVMCASGPAEAFEIVKEVIMAFTCRHEYLGPVGSGTKLKLVANLLVAVHNAAAAEALTFAARIGLDKSAALRLLSGSAAGSRQLELRGPMMVEEKFRPATATASIFLKDIRLIAQLAASKNCPIPMHSAASSLYTAAVALGYDELDLSCVSLILAGLSGARAEVLGAHSTI
jgi:3-hydroxyisobutyrate dehydrogenase-like beta-hydroxyacid dehydrogenase